MNNNRRRRRGGFTLMEVLLVLVILVILGSMAAVAITNTQGNANIRAAKAQIGLFKSPINLYHMDLNEYPPTLESLRAAPSESGNSAKWAGPYLEIEVPPDPWGNPYQYQTPGRNGAAYDVWSMGPDRADGTADDIGNWE